VLGILHRTHTYTPARYQDLRRTIHGNQTFSPPVNKALLSV